MTNGSIIYTREKIVCITKGAWKTGYAHIEEWMLVHICYPVIKSNQSDQTYMEMETSPLLEKWYNSLWYRPGQRFLKEDTSCTRNKIKDQQIVLFRIKNLLYIKGNQQIEGKIYRIRKLLPITQAEDI